MDPPASCNKRASACKHILPYTENLCAHFFSTLFLLRCSIEHIFISVSCLQELQHERDVLQERMSEQSLKITTLQSKLDEQRLRAEELHRQGTSHLTVKVHDLQNEVVNLKETLQTRDKQITSLKNFLENSQQVIERQEKELAMNQADNDRSQYELKLEAELQAKCDEIQQLKNKIQNDMINKLALPDLMETMLADKNEEIDQLKEKLSQLQSQHHPPASHLGHGKEDDNARTLSDIVSITDCDESDMVMRRLPEQNEGLLPTQHSIPMVSEFCMILLFPFFLHISVCIAFLTFKLATNSDILIPSCTI